MIMDFGIFAGISLEYNGIRLFVQAQAIMLIASSGNYSSYPHTKVQNGCGSQITELNTFLPLTQFSEGSVIHQPTICKVYTGTTTDIKYFLKTSWINLGDVE